MAATASNTKRRSIWCCGCNTDVNARLTDGTEVYPRRTDLARMPFWICDGCGNSVGTHHRHENRAMRHHPLGVIPTAELRSARKMIHSILDPLWQRGGGYKRRLLYATIAKRMGIETFHTAELRTIEAAREAYRIIRDIRRNGLSPTQETEP